MAKKKLQSNNELPKICKYCEFSVPLIDEGFSLCRKIGMVKLDHTCRKYIFDPLKHIPPPPMKLIKPDDDELIF